MSTSNTVRFGISNVHVAKLLSGTATTWAATHAYALNATITADSKVYKVTTAGTSGSTAPTWHASGTVTDGTVVWTYVSAASPYGTPIHIPGTVNLDLTAEGKENAFAADNNAKYYDSYSNNGYSGSLEVAQMPDEVLVAIFNFVRDSVGGLVETGDSTSEHFALLFEVDGDVDEGRYALYNVVAGRPTAKHATTSDSKTPDTESCDLSASSAPWVLVNGHAVTKRSLIRTDQSATVYDAWYDAVQLPTLA